MQDINSLLNKYLHSTVDDHSFSLYFDTDDILIKEIEKEDIIDLLKYTDSVKILSMHQHLNAKFLHLGESVYRVHIKCERCNFEINSGYGFESFDYKNEKHINLMCDEVLMMEALG